MVGFGARMLQRYAVKRCSSDLFITPEADTMGPVFAFFEVC